MRRWVILLSATFFFTACSSDQAVKKYYRACLRGHYLRARHYVIAAQRDSYRLFDEQKGAEEKAFLRRRKVKVTEVRNTQMSDTTAIASCNLIIRTAETADTVRKTVILKKEKGRWRICNGILFDK